MEPFQTTTPASAAANANNIAECNNVGVQNKSYFYIDSSSNQRRGPVLFPLLLRMLEKGAVGVGAGTLAWCNGQEQWKPLIEVRYCVCFS